LSDSDEDYCLIKGIVLAGVVVPIYSPAEREAFCVTEAKIEGVWEDHWVALSADGVFDVPGGLKHGWKSVSGASVSLLEARSKILGACQIFVGGFAASRADLGSVSTTLPLLSR